MEGMPLSAKSIPSLSTIIIKGIVMKQFVTLLFVILNSCMMAHAQNYLDHLKQKDQGQGVVTVNQSKAIDELVNGKQVQPGDSKAKPQDDKSKTNQTQKNKQELDSMKKTEQHHENKKEAAHENTAKKAETHKEETETPTVDMRKKVMSKSYKVTGYRVQAYAGGNSRNDRQKAEQIGNELKMNFPDQPVYVHFYSPRWICRLGNFKSQTEAQKMLAKVKAMGYKQACLVKGQITVQY